LEEDCKTYFAAVCVELDLGIVEVKIAIRNQRLIVVLEGLMCFKIRGLRYSRWI
jgi:hypothetical protein